MSVGLKSFGSRFGNLKVVTTVIWFCTVLLLNVCHDRFVGDIAAGRHEVSTSPQMPTPKMLLKVPEFLQQFGESFCP